MTSKTGHTMIKKHLTNKMNIGQHEQNKTRGWGR